jgi:hypothetical protein
MNIKISKNQYDKLKNKIQLEFDFPREIVVRFGGFKPDDYHQPTFVYLDEMPADDIFKLKKLKDGDEGVTVKLNNIYTKEVFDFPLEDINFTKSRGNPYIFKTEYEKIESELESHELVLSAELLKKSNSKFPQFMLDTLYELYPNNIGKNSFIVGKGICNSEDGLIDIPNTNVPGQTWSILNYFDTNPMVIKKLIEWFMHGVFDNMETPKMVSNEKFKEWIKNNSSSLFKDGEYLEELVNINLQSYKSGERTENLAIKKLTESPFNINRKNIKQYCSGSKQDRIDGKDIEITTTEGVRYAQIKPLTSINVDVDEITKEYEVYTYHMKNYKKKPIQYIIFVNSKNILIFNNKNYKLEGTSLVKFTEAPLSKLK